jgi:dihydrolipoamide dehydrogenase
MRTSVPGVWAVGDITGIMMLAHVAAAQGRCAAEDAMGLRSSMSYDVVPVCLYSRPELSKVGLSQDEAERDGRRVVTGRAHFSLNGGAVAQGDSSAMAEVVCDAGSEEVIGAQIIGPGATELIAEAASIIAMQGRIGEWAGIIHAHPTLSEVLQQAAESARRSLKLL